ncbi:MAG: acetyl-CoA carboxylase biotin carboxyl carrier protein subunit [Anaerolineales bacterium]|nr:MAG: acetyl-CoA carboxylase biotin carboxyl carrier protein subunit [Anaerolineales bacterium]
MKYKVTVEGETFLIEIEDEKVLVNGQPHAVDMQNIDDLSLYSLLVDNNSYEAFIEEEEGQFQVLLQNGEMYSVQVKGGRPRSTIVKKPFRIPGVETTVKAPMPGLVIDVLVTEGQQIVAGEVLVILESMKMENELRAQWDGTVQSIHIHPGDVAGQDQALVTVQWEEVGHALSPSLTSTER